MASSSSSATHRLVVGQETPFSPLGSKIWLWFVPSRLTLQWARRPRHGSVEVRMRLWVPRYSPDPTATHSDREGQDTLLSSVAPGTASTVHLAAAPRAGSVDVSTSPG